MKLLIAFVLAAVPSFPQPAILDDWNGATGTAVASTSPTIITINEPHGLASGSYVSIWGATGNWVRLNTQQESYLRMTLDANGTTVYLNDTEYLENTAGSTWQIFPEETYASCSGAKQEIVSLSTINDSRSLTLSGRGLTGSQSGAPFDHCPEDKFWGPLNRNDGNGTVPYRWQITVIDSTHFSIPLDSHTFGSFTGQTIHIARASLYNSEPVQFWKASAADGSPFAMALTSNHTQQFTIDGCPDKTNAIRCSFAYSDPMNQKGYGDFGNTGSLVVSGGTGTITLTTAFSNNTTQYTRTLQANELCWLVNFNEGSLPFGTINRPWIVTTVSGSPQTITIANMGTGLGGAGVPDGTYTTSTTKNFYFPIFADFYAYWISSATLTGYPTEYPAHTVKASGTPFSSSFNRFREWFQWGANFPGCIPMEYGTYVVEQPSDVTYHGYHTVCIDAFANQWELYETTAYPEHWVGSQTWIPQGTDSSYTGWIGYASWTGESNHYFDINWKFYLNLSSIYGIPGGQTGQVGPLYFDTVTAEPDEWASTRSVTYNPATSKYRLNVLPPPTQPATVTYNFYHSTSDIKSIGLNNAIHDGSATQGVYGGAGFTQVDFDSPALSLVPTMYWAVVPTMPISGVSGNGQSPIVISFRSDPNMQVGDHVTVAGVGGNTAANQTAAAISNVYSRTLLFRLLPSPSTPSTPGPLTSVVVTSGSPNVCTVNLTQAPPLVAGQEIGITGVPTGGPGTSGTGAQGVTTLTFFNVTGVSSNTFTFNCPGTTVGTYNTDYSTQYRMAIVVEPAIGLSGTGNGNWDGNFTGTLVSAENLKNFTEINFTPPVSGCQFATSSLPGAHAGTGYSQQISMLGCASPVFSVSAGSLPAWASLNTATGAITGTPIGATPTTSSFTIAVSDANGSPAQAFSLTTDTLPVFSTTSPLPAATAGSAYSQTLSFSAGDVPITCTATGVPAGLSLSSACVLSGTPSSSGAATINVTATNSSGDTQLVAPTVFALTINPASPGGCPGTVCVTGKVTISGTAKNGQ
ncbi:MAG TPA: Ig domain-containing protein [Bryobacteraceae bacterium]|nr:Ig domain-containing protein [Bryobacteraceae bacterium]